MSKSVLQQELEKIIKEWVGRNFGSQEVEDPSWDITALARCISKELPKAQAMNPDTSGYVAYELTVLGLPEQEVAFTKQEVDKVIYDNGGVITKFENDGVKRVPYAINGHDSARYIYYEVLLPTSATASKISSTLNIKDSVLRYLMVKQDTRRS